MMISKKNRVTLKVIQGPHAGQLWTFDQAVEVVIGRQAPSHLRFADEPTMSVAHCKLVIDPPHLTVTDLRSTNGTRVNGIPVAEAAVSHGDQFGVGQTLIQVLIAEEATDSFARNLRRSDSSDQTLALSPTSNSGEPLNNDSQSDFKIDPKNDSKSNLISANEGTQIFESASARKSSSSPSSLTFDTIAAVHRNEDAANNSENLFLLASNLPIESSDPTSTPEFCGPYQIEEQVGEGGMAVVFKAKHRKTGEKVAVKLIRTNVTAKQKLFQLFVREASVLLQLKHPRIVRSIEFGFQDEQPFLVMEWLPVLNLLDVIDPLPTSHKTRVGCGVISRVLEALHYAHQEGFVHRDVKPSNIMAYYANKRLQVKLGDFGLAKCFEDAGLTAMTNDNSVRGTLAYMPPEQLKGSRSVGPTSDIFSVGACLYRFLTGKNPKFTPQGVEPEMDVLRSTEIPSDLVKLVLAALDPRPEKRPQTAEIMNKYLQRHCTKSSDG